MIRVLFICHGNICRSPMAEYIFRDMARKAGCAERFAVSSAAVSREEIGNDIYPPAKRALMQHGIPFQKRAARQVTEREMDDYDWIIVMDRSNIRYLRRMFGDTYADKIHLLMEYAGGSGDVSDPWYTGDFETAYQDIAAGCAGFMAAYV